MKMTMTAAGDAILLMGYPEDGYDGMDDVKAYLAKGQAQIGSLDMCVTKWNAYGSAYCGGTWLNTTPDKFAQLAEFGFNFIGFANDHAMDYGPDGLLSTIRCVQEQKVSVAGAGRNLGEASQPVYRDFPGGRVAFISITSSADATAAAGYADEYVKGRPGLNTLGFSTVTRVTKEHMAVFEEVAKNSFLNGSKENNIRDGFAPAPPPGVFDFGSVRLKVAEDGVEGVETSCNKFDLERMRNAIKDAHYLADYVVVMAHCNQFAGAEGTEPAEFFKSFCRNCVDFGADAVIGVGGDGIRPVEIYNGKPILYSLGNFCFQYNGALHLPADAKEKFRADGMSDVCVNAAGHKKWTVGRYTMESNYRGIIPYFEFEDGKLTKFELKPISLGMEKSKTFRGLPYPANAEQAEQIYKTISDLSRAYGTKLTLNSDGTIMVEV